MKKPSVLSINPYIYDFAAYNFWSSPLGLLYISAILRENGFHIQFLDCMTVKKEKRKPDGRAPFIKTKVEKPELLKDIRKPLRRYGLSPDELARALRSIETPDIVLITSIMTYWYLGAVEISLLAREIYPGAKIIVGGIYPTLCQDQAIRNFPAADLVVGSAEIGTFYKFVEETVNRKLDFKPCMDDLDILPYPAHDLAREAVFVPVLTSLGCAFRCTYCATSYMYKGMVRRGVQSTLDEIVYWHDRGIETFALYDDSFLYKREEFAKPFLRKIARGPRVKIYNPNAVNAAFIDDEVADLCAQAGFQEIRIGLESVNPRTQSETGGKVSGPVFEQALASLKKAGYSKDRVSVYILAGLPRQPWGEVKDAIDYVRSFDVTPYIAEYTPIPHTRMYDEYKDEARFPITRDAMFQNNALFPYAWEGFTEEDLNYLKRYAKKNRIG
ncbi:MAG: radical SAM protein [Syntrophorhabdus sp.]